MKNRMRKVLSLGIMAILTMTTLAGCGIKSTTAEEPAKEESVVASTTSTGDSAEAAPAAIEKATSGSITVYTALEDDQIERYLESFYEQYPDIEVDVIRESTGTLIAKAIAEKDNPVADVMWGVSASVLLQLDAYDLIAGYTPEGTDKLDSKFYDTLNSDALWTGCDVLETAFCVNTDICTEKGIPVPQSFADLLDPCYEGLIVMPDPTSSGTGMLTVNGILQIMGEEEGWNYLNALNKNIASYTTSGSKPAKMAAAGECVVGLSFGYRCTSLLADGNPVEVVFPSEGCGWDVEANCLIKKDTIDPACYTFLDWAISDKAMEKYASEYPITGRGVIGEIPFGYNDDPLGNLCDLDLAKAALERDGIIEKFTPLLSSKEQ